MSHHRDNRHDHHGHDGRYEHHGHYENYHDDHHDDRRHKKYHHLGCLLPILGILIVASLSLLVK